MVDLDAISDRTYVAAGADFAFVITRRGRVMTRRVPHDMPREGRSQIVEAALGLGEQGRLGCVELRREDLVPYGGAAPVDVYFGVAAESILCVVMPTWADRRDVASAIERGLREIDEGTPAASRQVRAAPRRTRSRPRGEAAPLSARRPVAEVREVSAAIGGATVVCEAPALASRRPPPPAQPGRKRSAVAGLVLLANGGPPRSLARPVDPVLLREAPPLPVASARPAGSLPDIRIGEATLGRESLDAIGRELGGAVPSVPEIRAGAGSAGEGEDSLAAIGAEMPEPARAGSMPEAVRLELVSISRESLMEIAAEEGRMAAAGPRPWVPLVRPAQVTQPWAELPEDEGRMGEGEEGAGEAAAAELEGEAREPESQVVEVGLPGRGARAG
ncbi:hypothetical protein WME90_06915 [Sorangium sp. So ce375]|uniref:hypothetical protein n=1 Tax=Sorangium sp. So ce375 TaxID=3133306 RepID=UPI003F5BAD36